MWVTPSSPSRIRMRSSSMCSAARWSKRRRPWSRSTGVRWISSSWRTPAASASCAVPAPWTSTFLSPAGSLVMLPGTDRTQVLISPSQVDRACRSWRCQLHEANLVAYPVVNVHLEAHLLDVEVPGAVHIGDGNGHYFDLPIHNALSFPLATPGRAGISWHQHRRSCHRSLVTAFKPLP